MRLIELLKEKKVLLLDGAFGTEMQKRAVTDAEWQGKHGCNEILNLSAPHHCAAIHESYVAAGADIIETNTFGTSTVVLAEYGLADKAYDIAFAGARIARRAADAKPGVLVAGSLGPGTKLPSLGHADFDTIRLGYGDAIRGLLDGGVDCFLVETCQDPLQIKAAVIAIKDELAARNARLPIAVSITVETTGSMLVGTDIEAAIAIVTALGVDIMGINCATGPAQMTGTVQELSRGFDGPVLVMPNAGLPRSVNGRLVYTLDPSDFAAEVSAFVSRYGVSLVGGCCGTTPEMIRLLRERLHGVTPAKRQVSRTAGAASLYGFVPFAQDPRPFFIGERANTNGSREFRERLLADDWEALVEIGKKQTASGAHAVDLCVAYAGRDEVRDFTQSVPRFVRDVPLPLVIDTTSTDALEAALTMIGGKPVINSINLEDGTERAHRVCALAKRYGAAVIALTIDEEGMAKTAHKKLDIARRLYALAVQEHGLRPEDLIIDPLTFTLGSGDATLTTAAIETLEGIRLIKKELPGVWTLLGLSNISFGLSPFSRKVLNSVFLSQAVEAGLDMAIVNVAHIMPVSSIDPADVAVAMNLIRNIGDDPLAAFINHFSGKTVTEKENSGAETSLSYPEKLRNRVIGGSAADLQEILAGCLKELRAEQIINEILIGAMKTVGELFGSGRMQLPFVLKSAEVMKKAVDLLAPYLDKKESADKKTLVLATVKGDVHDIGKNLVDIILTNNGYRVVNLGIKVDVEEMVRAAREQGADAIGMSGLLVKSTLVMKENLESMKAQGMDIPVLLGGAALTRLFVYDTCGSILESPVVYCEDAFAGLMAMNLLKEGRLADYARAEQARVSQRRRVVPDHQEQARRTPVRPATKIPKPPFWGSRILDDIDRQALFGFLTEQVLFRGRWGFRRGKLTTQEFDAIIEHEARPTLERLKRQWIDAGVIEPKAVIGYWPCVSDGDTVLILDPIDRTTVLVTWTFPRQRGENGRCIADFFLPKSSGKTDLIALQAVTLGKGVDALTHKLYADGEYREYLFAHGLGVELAEALAEMVHARIRRECGIAGSDGKTMEEFVVQKYQGSRYSFGYPACPDLEQNVSLLNLLGAERIGITVTENGLMVPEQTTSAFIAHHEDAKYFAVE